MNKHPVRAMTLGAIALFLASCQQPYQILSLRTVDQLTPPCRDVGFYGSVILRGASDDPDIVWLEFPTVGRKRAVWPLGYKAAFGGDLLILDSANRAVLRGGDEIRGGCVTGDPDTLLVVPEYL